MCDCIGCKYSRGEVNGDEYEKWLEDGIEKAKKEGNNIVAEEGTEILIEYLKSKEKTK